MYKIFFVYVSVASFMMFGIMSLIAGLTTGVPMSPGYGGHQTEAPLSYYTGTT